MATHPCLLRWLNRLIKCGNAISNSTAECARLELVTSLQQARVCVRYFMHDEYGSYGSVAMAVLHEDIIHAAIKTKICSVQLLGGMNSVIQIMRWFDGNVMSALVRGLHCRRCRDRLRRGRRMWHLRVSDLQVMTSEQHISH